MTKFGAIIFLASAFFQGSILIAIIFCMTFSSDFPKWLTYPTPFCIIGMFIGLSLMIVGAIIDG